MIFFTISLNLTFPYYLQRKSGSREPIRISCFISRASSGQQISFSCGKIDASSSQTHFQLVLNKLRLFCTHALPSRPLRKLQSAWFFFPLWSNIFWKVAIKARSCCHWSPQNISNQVKLAHYYISGLGPAKHLSLKVSEFEHVNNPTGFGLNSSHNSGYADAKYLDKPEFIFTIRGKIKSHFLFGSVK